MAKSFARSFYSSKAWQDCRNEYMKRAHHLCEECLRRGVYKPAEIVHHKIEIDPVTIEKPEVALNFDNLEAVCRECHAAKHKRGGRRRATRGYERFFVNENGKVTAR